MVEANGIRSNPLPITIVPSQPGIFTLNQQGTGVVAALRQNQSAISNDNPAQAGEIITLFCTGLGAVTPATPLDVPTPLTGLVRTANTVEVTVGGKKADVAFAGLTPGSIALYQVNVTIPAGIAASNLVPVQISINGAVSNTVTVPLR